MVYKEYLERIENGSKPIPVYPLLVEEDDEFVESMFYYKIKEMLKDTKDIDIYEVFNRCGLFYSGFKGDKRIEGLYNKALKKNGGINNGRRKEEKVCI